MIDNDYRSSDLERLFVYGTMKQGFRNHARIGSEPDSRYLGDFITQEASFSMKSKSINGGSAPVVLPNGSNRIEGELYQIDINVLEYIDIMEGHPLVYQRIAISLKGVEQSAWMYLVESDEDQFSTDHIQTINGIASFVQ